MLASLACTCTRLRGEVDNAAMQLVGQRPDQIRAPRQDGQRWLAVLWALEEAERVLGAYISPHHDAFAVAVSKGGCKAGRRRFRLWLKETNGPPARRPHVNAARSWLTAALGVVARERPKLAAAVGAEEAQRFAEGAAAELRGMLAALANGGAVAE